MKTNNHWMKHRGLQCKLCKKKVTSSSHRCKIKRAMPKYCIFYQYKKCVPENKIECNNCDHYSRWKLNHTHLKMRGCAHNA